MMIDPYEKLVIWIEGGWWPQRHEFQVRDDGVACWVIWIWEKFRYEVTREITCPISSLSYSLIPCNIVNDLFAVFLCVINNFKVADSQLLAFITCPET